jgi:tetratricopeptide (TPR) repeat protein
VQAIYAETEGNPFFVQEVVKYLVDEGKLFDSDGRFRTDVTISELDVPEGVRLVIGRRLSRLGDAGRKVLSGAAVIGRDFSYKLLEAISDVDPDTLLDVVDETERAYLITAEDGTGQASFRFSHELIRQTLLTGLSLPRRQRLHLRVAEALERVYPDELHERAADLAHHLYQAGEAADHLKTARYSLLAGEQALDAAAFEEALRHFERASGLDTRDERLRADIDRDLGLAQRAVGRWDDALRSWERAISAYERLEEWEELGNLSINAAQQFAWAARFPEMLQVTARALGVLGDQAVVSRARLLEMAGLTYSLAGNVEDGGKMIDQSLALGQELGQDFYEANAGIAKTVHYFACMEALKTIETGQRAVSDLRQAGMLWDAATVLAFVMTACGFACRTEEWARTRDELEPLASRLRHQVALLLLSRNRWFVYSSQGEIEKFEQLGWGDLEMVKGLGGGWPCDSYTQIANAEFWRGDWAAALGHFEEAAKLEAQAPNAVGGNWGYVGLARAYLGDTAGAMSWFEQHADELAKPGRLNTRTAWVAALCMVEALAVLRQKEAAGMYDLVLAALETGSVTRFYDGRPLHCLAGMAAAAGERWDAAEDHFQAAQHLADELPLRIEQPDVRRFYAQMLMDRDEPGDRAKATKLAREAIDGYRKLGMPRHQEIAERLGGHR